MRRGTPDLRIVVARFPGLRRRPPAGDVGEGPAHLLGVAIVAALARVDGAAAGLERRVAAHADRRVTDHRLLETAARQDGEKQERQREEDDAA